MTEPTKAEIRQVLVDARELISVPERWIQGFDTNGRQTGYCLVGAVDASARTVDPLYSGAIGQIMATLNSPELTGWNDDPARTHPEVLALLDKAISEVSE